MCSDTPYIPFATREDWKDVAPVRLRDDETSAVNIAYSEQFSETFSYFRAILEKDERSQRAFDLTTEAAWQNPANYTVWQFRRVLLAALNKDLKEELEFCTEMITENPKNYQVWHHRKMVVESLKDPSKELEFVASVLREDSKNYHAWQHRHWVVKTYNLWDSELEYVCELLGEDLRNNSAWNYRYFVISNTTGFTPEVVDAEISFTKAFIKKAPHNESVWNYLNGLLIDDGISSRPDIWTFVQELRSECCAKKPISPFVLLAMFDYLEDEIQSTTRPLAPHEKQSKVEEAGKILNELCEIDPIRRHYYSFLKTKLEE